MATYTIKAELLTEEIDIELTDSEMEGLTQEEVEKLVEERASEWANDQLYFNVERKA